MANKDSSIPTEDEDLDSVQQPQESNIDEQLGATVPYDQEDEASEADEPELDEDEEVAESTDTEGKDPYTEGKHIANPEPNNGLGKDAEKGKARLDAEEAKANK